MRRRCERRGVGCKETRRRRCRGASGRSADAADGPAPPQPLGADGLLLAATEREEQQETPTELVAAICKRPDATPASVFPRAACQAARFELLTCSQRGREVSSIPLTPALSRREREKVSRSSLNAEIAEEFHPRSAESIESGRDSPHRVPDRRHGFRRWPRRPSPLRPGMGGARSLAEDTGFSAGPSH